MKDNAKLPEHYFAPSTLAQQEINRLTVDAHMMASTLASTAESLTEAQARNVQLAASLEMVQGECGMLMGKVAAWEARDSVRAPNIDAIALAAATNIAATCFAGVPGVKLTGRVQELVAEAMRAVPPPADQGETAREQLYRAATSCSHTIDAEEIILRRDPRTPGNALAQLANRLDDVFARLSADPIPLPAGPSEQPACERDLLDIVRTFCHIAHRMTELTDSQRENYPSPLSNCSPVLMAAQEACVERGYTQWGLAIEGVTHTPAAPSAKPSEAK